VIIRITELKRHQDFNILGMNYRVSIKSFPGYKHLLQESYMEYKLFFFKQ